MVVKCGRREFTLDKTDEILYNGACYQIVTQTYNQGFSEYYPIIAKVRAEKMIKDGILILERTEGNDYVKNLEYYRLNLSVE